MKKNKIYTILAAGAVIANAMSPLSVLAAENKASEQKPENKEVKQTQEQPKSEVKVVEVKQEQPKAEVKQEEVKAEQPKVSEEIPKPADEVKQEEAKPAAEVKQEQPKEETKVEEKKPEVKEEAKKPKAAPKQEKKEQTNVHVDVTTNTSSFSYKYNFDNDTAKFIASIAEQARVIGKKNDLYASVMIAQAILESGSGTSQLSQAPNNNLFGIKGAYKGQSVTFLTSEDDGSGNLYQIHDGFRKYETTAQSLEDYADLIKESGYYVGAWKSNAATFKEAAQYLQGRYATDTSYAAKLIGIIEAYDLQQYDEDVKYEKTQYDKDGNVVEANKVEKATDDTIVKLLSTATSQLGVPYVWGGATLDEGLDCSGFTQQVFKKALNMDLPRVTTDQEKVGTDVEVSKEALQPGDLVFFGDKGNSYHVGIYLSNGYFVNAPYEGRTVEVQNIKNFTPSFAKRVIPTTEITE